MGHPLFFGINACFFHILACIRPWYRCLQMGPKIKSFYSLKMCLFALLNNSSANLQNMSRRKAHVLKSVQNNCTVELQNCYLCETLINEGALFHLMYMIHHQHIWNNGLPVVPLTSRPEAKQNHDMISVCFVCPTLYFADVLHNISSLNHHLLFVCLDTFTFSRLFLVCSSTKFVPFNSHFAAI